MLSEGGNSAVTSVAVIDLGLGNVGSIKNMLKKIGVDALVTSDPQAIQAADKLILPGVGAFDYGMHHIKRRGLLEVLTHKVLEQESPLLGICLGMQLLTRGSQEGEEAGLGWIPADTVRFDFSSDDEPLKVPHMGWNHASFVPHRRFTSHFTSAESRYYFVHSYHVVCDLHDHILATTHYGNDFASIVGRDNIVGVQFHPEKSHSHGMKFLRYFVEQF